MCNRARGINPLFPPICPSGKPLPPHSCCLFSHSSAYSSVLLPQNFPPTCLAIIVSFSSSSSSYFFFFFSIIHDMSITRRGGRATKRVRDERRERRASREFPNDFGTNHSRHAFFLGGLCLVLGGLLLALRKKGGRPPSRRPFGTDRKSTRSTNEKPRRFESDPSSLTGVLPLKRKQTTRQQLPVTPRE